MLDPNEEFVFQLSENVRMGEESSKMFKFKVRKENYATLLDKSFIQLHLEHLSFLVKHVSWKVNKIYLHYTLDQQRIKKDLYSYESKIKTGCKKKCRKRLF